MRISESSRFRHHRRSRITTAGRPLTLEPLERRDLLTLIAYWSGNDTALDTVGGNNGTLYNRATYAAGRVGNAFRFDGVNDRINVPDSSMFWLARRDELTGRASATPVEWDRDDGLDHL